MVEALTEQAVQKDAAEIAVDQNKACDNVNGFCTDGCDAGYHYQGIRCQARK